MNGSTFVRNPFTGKMQEYKQRNKSAFARSKYPQAPRPNPPAERNPLKRTRGDKWRNAVGTLLGGDPNVGAASQQRRDMERFTQAFGQNPQQAIRYAQQAGRGDLVEYGQGLMQQQQQQAQAQAKAQYEAQQRQLNAQRDAQVYQSLSPQQRAAYLTNPEAFGESLSSNFEAQVLDPNQTLIRQGQNPYQAAPEQISEYERMQAEQERAELEEARRAAMAQEANTRFANQTGRFEAETGRSEVFANDMNTQYANQTDRLKAEQAAAGNTGKPGKFAAKRDEVYAKDYAEWKQFGETDSLQQIRSLEGVVDYLDAHVNPQPGQPRGKGASGWWTGATPDWLKTATGIGDGSEAIRIRETVEQVVQRNLRIVLGAQFAQKEGEQLIKRAFNPGLDESVNLERVQRLLGAMKRSHQQRADMAAYADRYGTLEGYEGNVPSIDDFYSALGLKRSSSQAPTFADIDGMSEAELDAYLQE